MGGGELGVHYGPGRVVLGNQGVQGQDLNLPTLARASNLCGWGSFYKWPEKSQISKGLECWAEDLLKSSGCFSLQGMLGVDGLWPRGNG